MIIGVSGKARSGKDTFAEYLSYALSEKTKNSYVMMAWAHALKSGCQRDFDLSYDQLYGEHKETPDKRYYRGMRYHGGVRADNDDLPSLYWTAREILQAYGEFYRTIDKDFWIKALFKTIKEKEYKNVIITDCRHPNEVDAVHEHGGYHIRVIRPNLPKIHGMEHISETALDNYENTDYTIINEFGLKELEQAAREVADFLIERDRRLKNG